MPDSFEVDAARRHIEMYGPRSSIERTEAENIALAQMKRESRQNEAAMMFAATSIGKLLGPIIGFVIAVVFLAYFFAGLVLLGLTLFGALIWATQFWHAPRSASVVFALVIAGAAVAGLYVPSTIPLGLFDFELPDWGGPAWNGMLLTVPLGMVIFSLPLGVWLTSGLQNLGVRMIQDRSVGARMVALIAMSALPLLIGLPLLIWVGVFGLPGAETATMAEVSSPADFVSWVRHGWSALYPRLFDGSFNAGTVIAVFLMLLAAWGVLQTFLLKRAADREHLETLGNCLSDY